jgi:SAM-dependent methyltransferase
LFDGAFSFGNSFGYLDDDGNAAFLQAVHRALKPGARFLIDAPTVAEALLPKFQERMWYRVDDILFLIEQHYDPVRARLDIQYTFIRGGSVDTRPASHRIYTYRELCRLLEEAGFAECTGQGSLEGDRFRLGAPRLLLTAVRR